MNNNLLNKSNYYFKSSKINNFKSELWIENCSNLLNIMKLFFNFKFIINDSKVIEMILKLIE